MKYVAPKVPEACIKDGESGQSTVCGRGIYSSEHVFHDAAYAMQHYADGKVLKVCPKCVETYQAREELQRQRARVA